MEARSPDSSMAFIAGFIASGNEVNCNTTRFGFFCIWATWKYMHVEVKFQHMKTVISEVNIIHNDVFEMLLETWKEAHFTKLNLGALKSHRDAFNVTWEETKKKDEY